jgi:hypothetical protein
VIKFISYSRVHVLQKIIVIGRVKKEFVSLEIAKLPRVKWIVNAPVLGFAIGRRRNARNAYFLIIQDKPYF